MNEPVNILVTCRNRQLLPAATLVFKTLRVGFPKGIVRVWESENVWDGKDEIRGAVDSVAAEYVERGFYGGHDHWIAHLLNEYTIPFWICDTDIVFWRQFQHIAKNGAALAGVRTPSFYEPWTRAQYRERLHTCLMRIDPVQFKLSVRRYFEQRPCWPFHPQLDVIHQQWQPERIGNKAVHHFYDTLAMAWHAFGGQEFTQEQIESFDHLNCATYADLIAPSQDFDMLAAHKAVYEDPARLRGAWARQFEWFAAHQKP